jgi:cytochrome c peroxidase
MVSVCRIQCNSLCSVLRSGSRAHMPDSRIWPVHPGSDTSRRAWNISTQLKVIAVGLLFTFGISGCSDQESTVTRLDAAPGASDIRPNPAEFALSAEEELNPRLLRRFKPLAAASESELPALVNLGRMLYFEPMLSSNGQVSCNSCHPLNNYGATNTAVSTGVGGQLGTRNAPSTYNAAGHFRQFWDGRVANVTEQVTSPIENPTEMGMLPSQVVEVLLKIDGYRPLFAAAYAEDPDPITMDHVAEAIAEFERGLITPARWDRYLNGETTALSHKEKSGAKLFANLGCMVCHEGQYLGGSMFQKVGVMIPWPNQQDRGRGGVSRNVADDMSFKVPSLRNVARTAPYFHDGSAATLNQAVVMMARHQLGVSISDDEANELVAWMDSLTGDIPRDYVQAPVLPEAHRP